MLSVLPQLPADVGVVRKLVDGFLAAMDITIATVTWAEAFEAERFLLRDGSSGRPR